MSTVLLAALGCALLVEIAVFVLAVTGNAEWFYTSQVYLPLSTSVTVLLILGGLGGCGPAPQAIESGS
ncbi:hypothetical protein [Plantibacter sp. RU18]|uniref:hypothetical protein n=1 Tax=Plantibacter sp. RU18 TaxID=3158143 RepID=UPI003D370164